VFGWCTVAAATSGTMVMLLILLRYTPMCACSTSSSSFTCLTADVGVLYGIAQVVLLLLAIE
jgi:hypothetical protein